MFGVEIAGVTQEIVRTVESLAGDVPSFKGKGVAVAATTFFLFYPFLRSVLRSLLCVASSIVQSAASVLISFNQFATTLVTSPLSGAGVLISNPRKARAGNIIYLVLVLVFGIAIGAHLPIDRGGASKSAHRSSISAAMEQF